MIIENEAASPRIVRQTMKNWLPLLLLSVLGVAGCQVQASTDATSSAASSPSRGRELFETCAECHGTHGEGSSEIGAPNIAGMNAWYIETELRKFRAGERGAQFDDIEGMRMRPMALSLPTEADIPVIAKYVESLPPVRHAPVLGGDAKMGKRRYALCSGCHNPDGGGNESVKAPRLAGLDDWYLATELKKFRGGVRGADPRDEEGTAMAPMAKSLANEKVIRDISAYISTLQPSAANSETQSQ
jgi:cytochrome c oxidase subunit 2